MKAPLNSTKVSATSAIGGSPQRALVDEGPAHVVEDKGSQVHRIAVG
jgi:hypothetical protein